MGPAARRASLFVALSGLFALELLTLRSLPYSTSWIDRVPVDEITPEPNPDFRIGRLEWPVSAYATDPSLQPFRDEFRKHCDGTRGQDAAMCAMRSIHAGSPLGNPRSEFVDAHYEPAVVLEEHLAGAPGHCMTRSAIVAAELLSVGIPALVVQIVGPKGEGGHNVFSVWDAKEGWVLVDPNAPGIIAVNGAPASPSDLLVDPSHASVLSERSAPDLATLLSAETVVYPEPWLYLRSGPRAMPWIFRGRFALAGRGSFQLGPAQKLLALSIALTAFALSLLAVQTAATQVLRLVRPRARFDQRQSEP